jgi:hypothetical protein
MVELVLGRIASPDQERQRVTVPTELIKRDSCRAIQPNEDMATGATLQSVSR